MNKKLFFSIFLTLAFFSSVLFISAQEKAPKRTERIPPSGTILLQPDPDEYISYWNSASRFPTFAGKAGNVLMSDGKDWKSVSANLGSGSSAGIIPSFSSVNIKTFITKPFLATGALLSTQNDSQTKSKIGLFNLPASIVLNQISYSVSNINTAGKYRTCLYNEAGDTKIFDVENTPVNGLNTVSIIPSISLEAGNYYIAMGCGSEVCDNAVVSFVSSNSNILNGNNTPENKNIYEGTIDHESGICPDFLSAITPKNNQTPVIRFDE